MKKILIFAFILIILFFTPNTAIAHSDCSFYYTSNIEHLFTHCLIAYPEIAFNKNNFMSKHYYNDCITHLEFKNILTELHKNNYALVDINSCFETIDGKTVKKKLKIPYSKKPLIFSFDDVNYDSKKQGMGMVDKIIVDKNGNIATQTLIDGKIDIKYDLEFVCILENFIKAHPDFSINGARGTINLTGYDGILGYRTSHTNTTNRQNEIKEATKVARKLKQLGWTFASHSYGHYHMNKISIEKFKQELNNWKN